MDRILRCTDCGRDFVWRYEKLALRSGGQGPPKRCPDCRSQRKYEDQPRRARPSVSSASGGQTEPESVLHSHRAPSIPLWRDLSRAEHYRYVSRFMHMNSLDLASLPVVEIGLFIQWLLDRRELEADSIRTANGRLDLTLTHKRLQRREFVRFYYKKRGMPLNALWDLFNTLQGTRFAKIHCMTVDAFTKAQKKTEHDFPLVLRLVEGEDLERYLREAQWSYHVELEARSARLVTDKPQARGRRAFIRKLWRRIRRPFLRRNQARPMAHRSRRSS